MRLLREPRVLLGFAALLVVMYALAFGARSVELLSNGGVDARGLPFGGDFVTFWSGSVLALQGRAIDVFDTEQIYAVQAAAIPGNEARFLWNYPPTFHLLVLPLGLVCCVTATILWWFATVPLYLFALWSAVPRPSTLVFGCAGTAVLLNLAHGQNGFLLTALALGGTLALLRKSPLLAGVLWGCLIVKPHLGLLLPIALLAAGERKAFWATGASVLGWLVASTLLFGVDYWTVFLHNAGRVREAIDTGLLPPDKLVTPYVFARTLGLSGTVSSGLQGMVTLGLMALVGAMFWRLGSRPLCWALLWVATTATSPYLFDYDLTLWSAALALAFLDDSPWGFAERELWMLAVFMPMVFGPLVLSTGVQWGPCFTLLLAASLLGRGRAIMTP